MRPRSSAIPRKSVIGTCVCAFTNPGTTAIPPARMTVFALNCLSISVDGPTAMISPLRIAIEPFSMLGPAIVMIVPPVMRMSAGAANARSATTVATRRTARFNMRGKLAHASTLARLQLVGNIAPPNPLIHHQHRNMTHETGHLADHPLPSLSFRRDHDLGRFFADLLENLVASFVEQSRRVRSLGALCFPIAQDVHQSIEKCRRDIREAGVGAGVTCGAVRLDGDDDGVAVAVRSDVHDFLRVAGGRAF